MKALNDIIASLEGKIQQLSQAEGNNTALVLQQLRDGTNAELRRYKQEAGQCARANGAFRRDPRSPVEIWLTPMCLGHCRRRAEQGDTSDEEPARCGNALQGQHVPGQRAAASLYQPTAGPHRGARGTGLCHHQDILRLVQCNVHCVMETRLVLSVLYC